MSAPTMTDQASILERARKLRPLIESVRDEMEAQRRMPRQLVQAMCEARLFQLLVPKSLGGLEVDAMTFARVIEEVSAMDGSAGWTLMIGSAAGVFAAFVPENMAKEVFGRADSIVAGALAPTGRAREKDGGYRVDGRWSFGSGIHHASWVGGNCLIFGGDAPRIENGLPVMRIMLVPANDVEIHDVWHVSGLRGTGSEDFSIRDVFVPDERAFLPFLSQPWCEGPLYKLPLSWFLSTIALVPLGIARAAIDALVELATTKVPMRFGAPQPLRERAGAQTAVARAEARLSSGRAFYLDALEDMWETVKKGREPSLQQRARLRLATCNAAALCAQSVDLAYSTGGGSSIYDRSLLQRCFRDVHAATQHVAVAPDGLEDVGRVLFGLQPASPFF